MRLPGKFGELDWSGWFYGLISGFVSGGAGAVSTGFVSMGLDPKDFNLTSNKLYILCFGTFVFNGLTVAMAYLAKQGLPPVVVERAHAVETSPAGVTVTDTVRTTKLVDQPEVPKVQP